MAITGPAVTGGILSYFTRHRTLANLFLILMVMAGLASFPNMRTQFLPDIVSSNVLVTANWENAGAEDIDRAIVQPLQSATQAVDGILWSKGSAREGTGTIRITFEPDYDMERAVSDVQAAVDSVTGLPDSSDEPEVRQTGWSERVTDVVISGPVSVRQLMQYADEFRLRLFQEGVTQTSVTGVAAPQVLVEVPSLRMIAHDVTLEQIAAAISAGADTDPAGNVAGAAARIRTGSEKRSPDELAGIVLRVRPDGGQLKVGDVARITRTGPDRDQQYFVAGNPAVLVRVDRSEQGDSIAIQQKVEQIAAGMAGTLPDGSAIELRRTRSEAISARLNTLVKNGLAGLGLVVCLLFLFLNARTAFWVAAGIPVAMLAALSIMYAMGITLNMISLFGLIITLGIIVDDAIVVAEHADFRARKLGEPPVIAAENAARRMSMPVFAATITTVIAFLGLTLIGGWFGKLIFDIPVTVVAVVIASLAECFLVLPNHMAHALASQARERWYDWPSRQVNKVFAHARDRLFRPMIAGVITARYVVLAAVIAILASQVAVFLRGDIQWRFFNAPERGTVSGNFMMSETAGRADSLDMMREMLRAAETVRARYQAQYGPDPVDTMIAQVGGTFGRGLSGADAKDKELLGGISIEFIEADERPFSTSAFVADLQKEVVRHPLAETVAFRSIRSGPGNDAISVQLSGSDATTLKNASLEVQDELARFPEVSALEDNLAFDKEEFILELTAQGQALGFTVEELGRNLRNRLTGIEAATYPDGTREASIRVELPGEEQTADFLYSTRLRTPDGEYVPLADIVTVKRSRGFGIIRRENGVQVVTVSGDISEDNPGRAVDITRHLQDVLMPQIASDYQVDYKIAGLAEQESTFLSEAASGLLLCLAGIYLVLAWIFGSWSRPFIVMAIIPFGLVGTIYGHSVWDVSLSMFTVVGLLGMTGIIVNDSIVLITTIDEYAAERGLIPSVIDGAADRLRPVMLTTLTTVLGMTPLLYETSRQAQFLKPTVITLVYGLGFGMVLVLLIVPALLAIQHDIARQIRAARRGIRMPVARVRAGFLAACSALFAWASVTFGWVLATGGMMPFITNAAPGLQALSPETAALAVFIAGSAVLCTVAYVLGAAGLLLARRRGSQPAVHP